jgi:GNAT superfamily N-acetyltransferase
VPEITRHGAEAIEAVRHLWLGVRDQHASVQPERGPVRDDDDTWARRSSDYRRWLAAPGAFLLLAEADGGGVIGYALVRPDAAATSWHKPERPALVETLSVSPEARGARVGAALLTRVRVECRREGFDALYLSAMTANRDALRFYEREGFAPEAITLLDTTYTP